MTSLLTFGRSFCQRPESIIGRVYHRVYHGEGLSWGGCTMGEDVSWGGCTMRGVSWGGCNMGRVYHGEGVPQGVSWGVSWGRV